MPTNAVIPKAIINIVMMVRNKLERTFPKAIFMFSIEFTIRK